MKDISFGIQKPSVIDLKIGQITYDPEATPDKIARQKLKYPPSEQTGFQLMGMRVC
jgi:inositol-polyphosphate multikinase